MQLVLVEVCVLLAKVSCDLIPSKILDPGEVPPNTGGLPGLAIVEQFEEAPPSSPSLGCCYQAFSLV